VQRINGLKPDRNGHETRFFFGLNKVNGRAAEADGQKKLLFKKRKACRDLT